MATLAPTPDLADLDISNLDLWGDGPPHETFKRLRAEEPLHWSELGDFADENGFWSVVRFDDIAAVGRDHETFSSKRSIILVDLLAEPGAPDPIDIAANMMITQDPPRHDRLKALVQRAFTPKRAIEHTERMREIINMVWDRALESHPDGRLDLVQDVGVYVPSMVIGDMLGAPARTPTSSSTGRTARPRSRTRVWSRTSATSGGRWRSSSRTSTRWSRSARPTRPTT